MKRIRMLAAAAAAVLVVAACGSDDDDAGGESSTEPGAAGPTATAAGESGTGPAAAAPTTTAPDGGAATQPATGPVSTQPGGGDATTELVADCQALGELLLAIDEFPANPEVGEEISDDFNNAAQSAVSALEGLDLQTEEVQSAVDTFVGYLNEILESDTWTEELDSPPDNPGAPIEESCGATFEEMGS